MAEWPVRAVRNQANLRAGERVPAPAVRSSLRLLCSVLSRGRYGRASRSHAGRLRQWHRRRMCRSPRQNGPARAGHGAASDGARFLPANHRSGRSHGRAVTQRRPSLYVWWPTEPDAVISSSPAIHNSGGGKYTRAGESVSCARNLRPERCSA